MRLCVGCHGLTVLGLAVSLKTRPCRRLQDRGTRTKTKTAVVADNDLTGAACIQENQSV
jgi:hypothetical protein